MLASGYIAFHMLYVLARRRPLHPDEDAYIMVQPLAGYLDSCHTMGTRPCMHLEPCHIFADPSR